MGYVYETLTKQTWLYAHRAAARNCDHRNAGRIVVAGDSDGS